MLSERLELPGQPVARRKSQWERFTLPSRQRSQRRLRRNSFSPLIVRPSRSLQRKRGLRCYGARCFKSPILKPQYPKKLQPPFSNSKDRFLEIWSLEFLWSLAVGVCSLVIADVHRCSHSRVVVKQFCAIGRLAYAAMRSGVARQNSDVHPDTFAGKAKEPLHGRAGKVRSARRGIDSRTDARAHDSARTIHKVTVYAGMMIRVLFHHCEMSARCTVTAFAG